MSALVDAVAPGRRADIDPGILALAERGRRFTVGDYLTAYTARAELHTPCGASMSATTCC